MEVTGKEAKIYDAILQTLDAQSAEIEQLHASYEELQDTCDFLMDDLADLEEALDPYNEDHDDSGGESGDFSESYIAASCPACAYTFFYDEEDVTGNEMLVCPQCGEQFYRTER